MPGSVTRRNTTIRDRHRAILRKDEPPCGICGQPIDYTLPHLDPGEYVVDHITALARGGTDELANKQAAHRRPVGATASRATAPATTRPKQPRHRPSSVPSSPPELGKGWDGGPPAPAAASLGIGGVSPNQAPPPLASKGDVPFEVPKMSGGSPGADRHREAEEVLRPPSSDRL